MKKVSFIIENILYFDVNQFYDIEKGQYDENK